MKQVFNLGGDIVVEELPVPGCGKKEVLVRNMFSLISTGTEGSSIREAGGGIGGLITRVKDNPELAQRAIAMVRKEGLGKTIDAIREQRRATPLPLGYSSGGIVLELGEGITDISIGDRVACGGAGYANHAEIISVPRNLVCKVPGGVDFDEAGFTTLGAVAIQGIRRARVELGDRTVVLGLGLVGQIVCQILKACGAFVIGIDTLEERVRLAEELGLDTGLLSGKDPVSRVMDHTDGLGADAVIICAATRSSEPANQAIRMARKKGRVAVIGAVGMALERAPLYEKEVDFLISCSYGPGRYDPLYEVKGTDYPIAYVRWTENRNMQAFLDLLATGKVEVKGLIGNVFTIENAKEAYRALRDDGKRPIAVMLRYPAPPQSRVERARTLRLASVSKAPGRINVGVIGAGTLAQAHHLPNLVKSPHFSVGAVCDKVAVTAAGVARKYGAGYCSTDYRDILDDEDIDMVIIATRHDTHAPLIREAADSGKHVLVEKPVALTLEQCGRVLEETDREGVNIAVDFNRRFSPLARKAKALARGRGGPMVINYRVNSAGMGKDHWINDPEEGGGAIIGEACHFFDFMSWLVGAEPRRIHTEMISTSDPSTVDANNIACTVSYEDGSIASLVYCTLGSEAFSKERVEIFMDGGVIAIEDFRELEAAGLNIKGERLSVVEKGQFELLQEYGLLLKGEGEGADLPDLVDGVKATACSIKALESLRTGEVQEFDHPW
ncbi:MAG: bi-domain-containing oxidoreductase [Actinomycetota bacterium]|nr:bi-domain-containing oxidoreductase [Actinomycetota bacterium]